MRTIEDENALIENLSIFCRAKLRGNAHKKHWTHMGEDELLELMENEIKEFYLSLGKKEKPSSVWMEAADIANIVAMVADSYQKTWKRLGNE